MKTDKKISLRSMFVVLGVSILVIELIHGGSILSRNFIERIFIDVVAVVLILIVLSERL